MFFVHFLSKSNIHEIRPSRGESKSNYPKTGFVHRQQLHASAVTSCTLQCAALPFEVAADFYYTLGYRLKMERVFEELNDEFKGITIDIAHYETEIDDLKHSLFVLGERKELLLVIEGGVVRLSNRKNFVMLTSY